MDEKTAIKKGFNAGYWLEKYEPELARMLQDSFGDPKHPYAQGFVMGSREFTQEQFAQSDFSNAAKEQSQEQEIDMQRDHLEIESTRDSPDMDMDR